MTWAALRRSAHGLGGHVPARAATRTRSMAAQAAYIPRRILLPGLAAAAGSCLPRSAVRALCFNNDNQVKAAVAGGIEALVSTLRTHVDNQHIMEARPRLVRC